MEARIRVISDVDEKLRSTVGGRDLIVWSDGMDWRRGMRIFWVTRYVADWRRECENDEILSKT